MGDVLRDKAELLFRQIPKEWFNRGKLSSLAFRPLPKKDRGKLSGDRESLTTAESSYLRFKESGGNTVAVYGVAVGEFNDHEIACRGDPLPDNPAHALADLTAFSEGQTKKKSQKLRDLAIKRGKIYPES